MGIKDFYNKFALDRREYPESVVPLGHDYSLGRNSADIQVQAPAAAATATAAATSPKIEETDKTKPDAEADKRSNSTGDSNADDRLANASFQEKGSLYVPQRNANGTTTMTYELLRSEVETDISASGLDTAYDRKAKVINIAIQDIGMGRYQWELYILCGMGWVADNLWLQGIALTLTSLSAEFGISESYVRFTTCSLFVGLIVGATFWGFASDTIGRRPAFNMTLFLCGSFGLAAGGGNSWVAVCALFACLGLGVGGNLPVDAAIFLEFLPFASGNILSSMAVFWSVGNLIASALAWGFIPNFSCSGDGPCTKEDNWGWRYLVLTLGAITFVMFLSRFFLFTLYESPKFLVSRGRQKEAVAAVQGIAHHNKTTTWLTEEVLNEIGGYPEQESKQGLTYMEIIGRNLSRFSFDQIMPLFRTKRLGITTALIWFLWTTIGMGYTLFNAFLPQYISNNTTVYETYRNYCITAACGVPGPLLAGYTVNIKYVGRKGTLAISTMLTGVLLFCFTATDSSETQLVCSALESFMQMIMYGVLYAYTPEVFPAPNRGTGTGIASCLNRIAGLCAPIIAIYGGSNASAPIYAAGALLLASFVAMCCLPIETLGKQIM